MTFVRLLLLFWFALLYCVAPAHAETQTEAAIRVLCGSKHVYLAPHVDEAARRYLLRPVVLVAVMRQESHCRPHVIGRHRDTGLMQVRGRARNGLPRKALLDPRTNILTGARWLSMMVTWCEGLTAGLGAYNTGKCSKGKGYARRVLANVAKAKRAIWQQERRS